MPRKFDPENVQIGQKVEKEISATGKAEVVKETEIEVVEGPDVEEKIRREAFMEEEVEVLLYEPLQDGEENVVQLVVNGRNQFVARGIPQKIKRKYLEVLARARNVTVTANGYKRPDGEVRNVVHFASGLKYPFQVLHDPNPEGPAWLKKILAEN